MKATTLYDFMRAIDYINTIMIDFYSGHYR